MSSPWKVFMDAFKKASTPKVDPLEEARSEGLLGPTTQDESGSFDPIQRPAPEAPDPGGVPIPYPNTSGDAQFGDIKGESQDDAHKGSLNFGADSDPGDPSIAPISEGGLDAIAKDADPNVADQVMHVLSQVLQQQSESANTIIRNVRAREVPADDGGEHKLSDSIAPAGGDGTQTVLRTSADPEAGSEYKIADAFTGDPGKEESAPALFRGGSQAEVKDSHDRYANLQQDNDVVTGGGPGTGQLTEDPCAGGEVTEEPATLVNLNPRGPVGDVAGIADGSPEEEEEPTQPRASADPEEGGEYKSAGVMELPEEEEPTPGRMSADPEEGGDYKFAGIASGDMEEEDIVQVRVAPGLGENKLAGDLRLTEDPCAGGEIEDEPATLVGLRPNLTGAESKIAEDLDLPDAEDGVIYKTSHPDWKLAAEQKLADEAKLEQFYKMQIDAKSEGDQKIQRLLDEDQDNAFGEHKIAGIATASSGDEVAEGVGEAPSDVQDGLKVEIDRFGADVALKDSPDVAADQAIGGGRQPGLQQVFVEDDGQPPEEDGRFGRPEGDGGGDETDEEESTTLVSLHTDRSVAAQLASSRAQLADTEVGDVDLDTGDDLDEVDL